MDVRGPQPLPRLHSQEVAKLVCHLRLAMGRQGPRARQALPEIRQPSWAQAPHKLEPCLISQPLSRVFPQPWWGWDHLAFPVCLGRAQAKPEGRHRAFHSPVTQELGLPGRGRHWGPHPGSDSLLASSAGCARPHHRPSLLVSDFPTLGIYHPTIQ